MNIPDLGHDVHDRSAQPPDRACERCATEREWEWSFRLGRWLPPSPECKPCLEADADATYRRDHTSRQALAGIPSAYRSYSFTRFIEQSDEEDWDDLAERLKRLPPQLCVTRAARDILAELSRWRLEPGKIRTRRGEFSAITGSVWLEGQPGTGKTMLALAKANDLLAERTRFVDNGFPPGDRRRRVRPVGGISVVYLSEEDVYSSIRSMQRGHQGDDDADPVARCHRAGLLILDDLGAVGVRKEWMQDVMLRILDVRYRTGRPIWLTSNLAMPELVKPFGQRFVSRLVEMVGDRAYSLPPIPWRNLAASRAQSAT